MTTPQMECDTIGDIHLLIFLNTILDRRLP